MPAPRAVDVCFCRPAAIDVRAFFEGCPRATRNHFANKRITGNKRKHRAVLFSGAAAQLGAGRDKRGLRFKQNLTRAGFGYFYLFERHLIDTREQNYFGSHA